MATQKPSTPKGTRDFSPDEMMRRNFIFDTIRSVFKKYGYQPIETPAMENIETLTGKYGDEGDQLLFKILNSRPFDAKDEKKQKMRDAFELSLQKSTNSDEITEKALRYDLTVPFARYVVQHQAEITFPFKRYQIQPVWRADRPQKGRYREFFQCDADVIGSTSLINEVELVQMIDEVFEKFNIDVVIKINNRKVLSGLIEELVIDNTLAMEVIIALDKLDKIGAEGVLNEMVQKGVELSKAEQVLEFVSSKLGANITALSDINLGGRTVFNDSETGVIGWNELRDVVRRFRIDGPVAVGENETYEEVIEPEFALKKAKLEIDFFLARGLNYYTGAIFEVKVIDKRSTFTSSICGGGRYDDLTGIFGLPNVSGVGISFGIDRIFDVLNEVGYPEDVTAKEGTRVLFANFGGEDEKYSLKLLKQVRDAGIAAEIYLDAVKMGKQFKYADAKKIPFVAIIGENERKTNSITLKNMQSGEQFALSFAELLEKIK